MLKKVLFEFYSGNCAVGQYFVHNVICQNIAEYVAEQNINSHNRTILQLPLTPQFLPFQFDGYSPK